MQVEIVQIIDESPRVKRFVLMRLDGNVFEFIPGQFVIISNHVFPEGNNTRSYSISSVNSGLNTIELCIALKPGGLFSNWLFQLNSGDKLNISEPNGNFVFKPEYCESPCVFICTGTGVAPFLSMIQAALVGSTPSVTLVFGNRIEEDILYRDYFRKLEIEQPRFKFIPVLSRDNWLGAKGYVHDHYIEILKNLENPKIFVCGWQEMCIQTRGILKELGFNRKSYFFEQYD